MKTNYTITILLFVLVFFCRTHAQEEQPVIAFTGFNSANPDGFCFLAIEQIPAGTTIFFTDKGWQADGSFRQGEGILEWTSPSGGIAAGTVVTIFKEEEWIASAGNSIGSVTLASGADQILAFMNTESDPIFLTAVNFNSTSGWDADAGGTDQSALPPGLTNDSTALALPALENSVYAGTFTGTVTEVLKKINNPAHWYGSDAYHFNLESNSFPLAVLNASGAWDDTSNWKTGNLPGTGTSVIVAEDTDVEISASGAVCNNLYIEPRGTLWIQESGSLSLNGNLVLHSRSASYAAAIINKGYLSVAGTTTYERYVHSDDWHLVASPVTGQMMSEFVQAGEIQYFEDEQNYDLAPYNEANDNWGPYTSLSDDGALLVGTGYAMRRSLDASSEGVVSFTGTLNQSAIEVPVSRNSYGWNCVGNPFASALKGTGNNSFLQYNSNLLDPVYAGLYLWNYEEDDYTVYVNSDDAEIAPCQGFFITAKENGGSINFTTAMQVFASPSFKSEEIPWPEIILTIADANDRNSTRFVFNDEMSLGLDPTYDAGKFKGNPDFALYSKLPDGNPADFAVQSLPLNNQDPFRIPIGFDCTEVGEVTFTATTIELPVGMQAVLEDTENNTFTQLDIPGSEYKTTVAPGVKGTGRFFLHTGEIKTTATDFSETSAPKVYLHNNKLIVRRQHVNPSEIILYNLSGQVCISQKVTNTEASIDILGFPHGIYILEVKSGNLRYRTKVNCNTQY